MKFKERNVPMEPVPNLLVWYGRPMPANAFDLRQTVSRSGRRPAKCSRWTEVPDPNGMLLALGVEFPPAAW